MLWKSYQRALGTYAGAILSIISGLLFSQNTLIFCLVIFILMFIGFYMMNIYKRFMYAWLFGTGTAVVMLLYGLSNPAPEHFILVAFNRSTEITLGIIASFIASCVVFHESFLADRQTHLCQLCDSLGSLVNIYISCCQGKSDTSRSGEYIKQQEKIQVKRITYMTVLI